MSNVAVELVRRGLNTVSSNFVKRLSKILILVLLKLPENFKNPKLVGKISNMHQ